MERLQSWLFTHDDERERTPPRTDRANGVAPEFRAPAHRVLRLTVAPPPRARRQSSPTNRPQQGRHGQLPGDSGEPRSGPPPVLLLDFSRPEPSEFQSPVLDGQRPGTTRRPFRATQRNGLPPRCRDRPPLAWSEMRGRWQCLGSASSRSHHRASRRPGGAPRRLAFLAKVHPANVTWSPSLRRISLLLLFCLIRRPLLVAHIRRSGLVRAAGVRQWHVDQDGG